MWISDAAMKGDRHKLGYTWWDIYFQQDIRDAELKHVNTFHNVLNLSA
jgi:hypothetical protein